MYDVIIVGARWPHEPQPRHDPEAVTMLVKRRMGMIPATN